MPRVPLIVILSILAATGASCSHKNGAPEPDAAVRLQAIQAADTSKLPSLEGAKHWSNPYLVVRPDNIRLLTDVAANEEQILKPSEVLDALAQLPAAAWPYGRVVAILVDGKQADSEQQRAALRRNRGIVEGDLEGANVGIRWIPNS
jgi:hypothetical protein